MKIHAKNNPKLIQKNIWDTLLTLTTFKHSGFSEENEIRFACLNRLERRGGGYHNISPYPINTENTKPRIEINFSPSAIKKIIIGPQPKQDELEAYFKNYLKSNGYENVELVRSSIPFIPLNYADCIEKPNST